MARKRSIFDIDWFNLRRICDNEVRIIGLTKLAQEQAEQNQRFAQAIDDVEALARDAKAATVNARIGHDANMQMILTRLHALSQRTPPRGPAPEAPVATIEPLAAGADVAPELPSPPFSAAEHAAHSALERETTWG